MKTYVISMNSDMLRREHITEECRRHGLDYELVDAVSGSELTDEALKEYVLEPEKCGLIKNEIACTISHLNIYHKMLREGVERALILEDDAYLGKNVKEVMAEIEQYDATSDSANLYLLTKVKKYIENFGSVKLDTVTMYKIHRGGMAQAYIINRKTAESFIRYNTPIIFKCDDWEFVKFATDIHIYCVMPYLAQDYHGTVSIIGDIDSTARERTAYHLKQLYSSPLRWLKIQAYRIIGRQFMKIVKPEIREVE